MCLCVTRYALYRFVYMNFTAYMSIGWQSVGDKEVQPHRYVCGVCMYKVHFFGIVKKVYICHSPFMVSLWFPAVVLSDTSPFLFHYHHWWCHIVKSPCTNRPVAGKSVTRCDTFWLPCLREEHALSRYEPNPSRQPLLDTAHQNKNESKHALGRLKRHVVGVVLIAGRWC